MFCYICDYIEKILHLDVTFTAVAIANSSTIIFLLYVLYFKMS